MRELERRQLIRQYQQQEAKQKQSIPIPINDNRDEAATQKFNQSQLAPITAGGSIDDSKKQTQFTLNLMGAKPFVKRDYGKIPLRGAQENKANLSLREQTQYESNSKPILVSSQACAGG
jgi:hypothetical protein